MKITGGTMLDLYYIRAEKAAMHHQHHCIRYFVFSLLSWCLDVLRWSVKRYGNG